MRRSPAARQVRPCSASARPRDHAHPPFSYCTGVPRRVRVSHRRLEAACRSRGSAGTLSLVYSVGDILVCCPGLRQGPFSTLGGEPLGFRSGLWVPGSQGPVPVGPGLSVPCRRLALAPHPGTCRQGRGLLGKERWEASENIEAPLVAASGIGYIVAAESAAAKHLHALRTCFMHLDNS